MAKLRVRTITVEPEDDKYLQDRAKQERRSVSNYVRWLIAADREKQQSQPQEAA